MRRGGLVGIVAPVLAALVVSLVAVSPLRAAETVTLITVDPPAPVAWGSRATVSAHLWLDGGIPVAGHHLNLHVAGGVAGGETDATGKATFDIAPPANPGVYPMQVTFDGSTDLLPSQAEGNLTVQPRLLTIHALPANPGLTFKLGSTEFVTDANGIASTQVPANFDRSTRPKTENLVVSPGVEARFDRWRTHDGDLYATYEMYYDVLLRFVDLAGNEVDPTRVTSVQLKGSIGNELTVEPGVPFEVLGQRVVPLAGELELKDVGYSIEDVVIDGASAVHRAQQRFNPSAERVWTITLLFYSVHFSVRDAIFGFPLGSEVGVTYPDGRKVTMPAEDGELSLTALARGDYSVTAKTWGLSFQRPIALSRDQSVELKVISFLDIGVVAAMGLLVVFGLVLVGRPGTSQAVRPMLRRWRTAVLTIGGARAIPLAETSASGIEGKRAATGGARSVASARPARPAVAAVAKSSGRANSSARRRSAPGISQAARAKSVTVDTRATKAAPKPAPVVQQAPPAVQQAPPAVQPATPEASKVLPVGSNGRAAGPNGVAAAKAPPAGLDVPPTPANPGLAATALGSLAAAPHQVSIRWELPRVRRTYVVQDGDTLRSIAAAMLGDENTWQDIVAANPKVTIDQGQIPPGTRLKIP